MVSCGDAYRASLFGPRDPGDDGILFADRESRSENSVLIQMTRYLLLQKRKDEICLAYVLVDLSGLLSQRLSCLGGRDAFVLYIYSLTGCLGPVNFHLPALIVEYSFSLRTVERLIVATCPLFTHRHQRTHFYQLCKSLLTAGETPISDTLFRRMMATSKARLTSLPTEILSIIFSDESVGSSRGPTLSLTDLGAVRLSRKAFQSPATAIFAQRYFQNPYVMIWKESLEALLDICRHPVFGPCVRKIEFLARRLQVRSCTWLSRFSLRPRHRD